MTLQSTILDDGATVLTLVLLEALLSGDNALVLAVMVKPLPESQRGRALRYGLIGAFVFRALAVLAAGFLIRFWLLKAAGALYLLILSARYFWKRLRQTAAPVSERQGMGFWKTVFWIEVVDMAFSLDSIMAAVGMSSKIYIVYLGGILGMISVRFIAGYVVKLLERLPTLETAAYAIVAWIGSKLAIEAWLMAHGAEEPEAMPKWLFWMVMVLIFLSGCLFKGRPQPAEN